MTILKSLITKIHVAKSQTGIDEESYRAMLWRISNGKTSSSKGLTTGQAEKVLEEFQAKGWKPRPSRKAKGKPHNFKQLPGEVEVIEAQLAALKLPWSYADSIAKQMFGIPKVAWLVKPSQFKAVLAALHVEQEKRDLLRQVENLCRECSIEHPDQVAGLEQLPKDWRRQRPILKALVDALHAAAAARKGEACA